MPLKSLSFDSALQSFKTRCEAKNLSPETWASYEVRLLTFRKWLRSRRIYNVVTVTPAMVRDYLQQLKTKGNGPATVECAYRVIRTFFGAAYKDGLLASNPVASVDRPRVPEKDPVAFRQDTFTALLGAIDTKTALGKRDYAMVLLMADAGVRIGEVLKLQLSDLEPSNLTLNIRGKGGKNRVCGFGAKTLHALLEWLRRRGNLKTPQLFVNRFGDPLLRHGFTRRLKDYTRRAGLNIPRLSNHSLRHFYAVSYLQNKGDSLALQQHLGHSTLNMTKRYCKMTNTELVKIQHEMSPIDRMGPLPGQARRVLLS